MKKNSAIALIGGADGPTSIYIAGRLGGDVVTGTIVVGVILVIAVIVVILKKQH